MTTLRARVLALIHIMALLFACRRESFVELTETSLTFDAVHLLALW
jgi:hypothetical protein